MDRSSDARVRYSGVAYASLARARESLHSLDEARSFLRIRFKDAPGELMDECAEHWWNDPQRETRQPRKKKPRGRTQPLASPGSNVSHRTHAITLEDLERVHELSHLLKQFPDMELLLKVLSAIDGLGGLSRALAAQDALNSLIGRVAPQQKTAPLTRSEQVNSDKYPGRSAASFLETLRHLQS